MKLSLMGPPPRPIRGLSAAGLIAAGLVLAPALMPTGPSPIPTASAACPDAELVFARGRQEPAGAGALGNAFIGALRSKVNRNVGMYAVQYPADTEVATGANDMSAHVQQTINNCPNTRVVLGGYSLGAAVTDVVMAAPGPMLGFTNPLPPGSDQHIAAVALFGNGTKWVGPIANFNPACATGPTPSATRPIRTPGRTTGHSTWPPATSRTASSIRPPTSSPASWRSHVPWPNPHAAHSGLIVSGPSVCSCDLA